MISTRDGVISGQSSFESRDLAVEAYEHCPPGLREPFDAAIKAFHKVVEKALVTLEDAEAMDGEVLRIKAGAVVSALQELIGLCNSLIHGERRTLDQEEIDDLMSLL